MPYAKSADLPERLLKLPRRAQLIYRKAFNHAWKQYANPVKRRTDSSREEISHRVAWSAVKQVYQKRGEVWVRKL